MSHIEKKIVITKKIEILPCIKCGSDNIDIGDCGYSSFNVAWGKCRTCGHEVSIKPCDWNIAKEKIVESWNRENDPEVLRDRYNIEIILLQQKIDALPKK